MPNVVLITGCSSGLGRALAQRLHAQRDADGAPCYTVYTSARNAVSLRDLAAQGLRTVQLDVTNQKSVDSAVKKILGEANRIDILINNAGLSRVGPIVEQPMSEVEEVLNANFFGVIRVTQAVAPHMMRQRGGLVVMIGSVTSLLSAPFGAAYAASKAALLSLSDALRLELQPFGVHVTHATAGAIRTSIADNIVAGSATARYERPTSLYAPLAGMIRSSFSDNIVAGSAVARYEKPTSLYAPLADMIRARAQASQDPKVSVAAADAADQIARVIAASALPAPPPAVSRFGLGWLGGWLLGSSAAAAAPVDAAPASKDIGPMASGTSAVWRPRVPPTYFLVGGNARQYFLAGVVQKLLPSGAPANGKLAATFGLDKPVPLTMP
ncbi:short-chain dehydrogenase reductase isoform C [Micractinium conductrix]|uniref:Short-chain dehydrogenase reductase isoform C n=1 Tax=Micractinium conductrix TaxID=554055 RepID=A0A2P6VS15_9CHLO|nr:short-chain dehydrogenase reductase isoform C [Micractinium conductrix]|eukprot:PSC76883.1 short-chain dehydrogenase reductase isoform C [Micractinium conductrix]